MSYLSVAEVGIGHSTSPNDDLRIVEIQNAVKSFRQGSSRVFALQDVSLTVRPSEFVAVLGGSGSGKSTLMQLIAGFACPDSGKVEVDGLNLATLQEPELTFFRRERIGLIFQSFNLIPTLTAEENVQLPVLAGGCPGPVSSEELLQRVGLQNKRHYRAGKLSLGEQQRVAIARVLASDVSLLLADEPTGNLDSVASQSLCKLLKELNADFKRSIVIVTHEPAIALWADRVFVLERGQVLMQFETTGFADAKAIAAHYHDIQALANVGGKPV